MLGLSRYSIGVTGGRSETESIHCQCNFFRDFKCRTTCNSYSPAYVVPSSGVTLYVALHPPRVLVANSTRQRHLVGCSGSTYLVSQHQNTRSSISMFVRAKRDSVSLHKSFPTYELKQPRHCAIFYVATHSTKGIKPHEDKSFSQRRQEYGVIMQYQNDRKALRCARVARRYSTSSSVSL